MTLRKTRIRPISDKQREKNREKAEETQRLHQWMREIWDEREDEAGYCYCFETGQPLHGSVFRSNTCCYDHVLEKNDRAYPQYKFVKKNIVIVHPDVHTRKGQNIDETPRIKAYREQLLELHYQDKLND